MLQKITAFYSYKGGVGRSMAIANVATLLAKQGHRVLVVDFDLDAPGLHRYFLRKDTRFGLDRWPQGEQVGGVIELFVELRTRLKATFAQPGCYDPGREEDREQCRSIVEEVVASYAGLEVQVGTEPAVRLRLLPAARFDNGSVDRIRQFEWRNFYEEFAEAFDDLRDAWKKRYDYVLIDSRSGLTDIGSVSAAMLPDRLVVVFSPNEQSLHGALGWAQQAIRMHREVYPEEKFVVLPLMSRVEGAETELRGKWIADAAARFSKFFQSIYQLPDVDMQRYFNAVHVPHSAYFAYGEKIAVEETIDRSFTSLVEAYARFTDVFHCHSVPEWLERTPLERLPSSRLGGSAP